jgi:hypothetical protein
MNIYEPVFAGKIDSEDRPEVPVVVYKNLSTELYHMRIDGGDLLDLGEGAMVETSIDTDREIMRIRIQSDCWTGTAHGTKWDFMQAASL